MNGAEGGERSQPLEGKILGEVHVDILNDALDGGAVVRLWLEGGFLRLRREHVNEAQKITWTMIERILIASGKINTDK